MNLTFPDIAILSVAFAVLQFLASTWVKSRLESSIKHEYDRTLDVLRKQRDVRVAYLIDAFRVLTKRANLPKGKHPELAAPIESALADIQLLGTPSQIEAAKRFAQAEARNEVISMDDLLNAFRAELRAELSLPPIEGPIWTLRYEKSADANTKTA
jgi:hypothetical protein